MDPDTLFGTVRAYALPFGQQVLNLAVTPGCEICGLLGTTVLATQDLDGDSLSDFVTSYMADTGSGFDFRVGAFSLMTGAPIWERSFGPFDASIGSSNLAQDLALVSDQDGDGQDDILVGVPLHDFSGLDHGQVSILSSATGQPLRSFYGLEEEEQFGARIAGLGDLDGDGSDEALILSAGTPTLRLFELDPTGSVDCFALLNSTGQRAQLHAAGSLDVGINEFQLSASPVPDQPGIFFYGPNAVQVPFDNGVRCVGGFLSRLGVTSPQGGVLWNSVDFANPPTPLGQITAGRNG